MNNKKHKDFKYFIRTFSVVIGIVIIWRGIWHILDLIEKTFFNGEILWTSLAGIVIGALLLYVPDYDLKEIEKL